MRERPGSQEPGLFKKEAIMADSRRRGPSNRTRRIITISVAALLLIAALSLLIYGIVGRSSRKAEESSQTPGTSVSSETSKTTKKDSSDDKTKEDKTKESGEIAKSTTKADSQTGTKSTGLFVTDASYAASHDYCIAVNTRQNIVTVYGKDADGSYTKPVKAFVCSCGKYPNDTTKLGRFYTEDKWRWEALYGGVYGQYAIRITGPYLFHSVPYYQQDPSTLETEEYNKLGENASLGCVRMRVIDVKWLYDNTSTGTQVYIYDDAGYNEPLAKPAAQRIDLDSPNAGWDPTDPDPANPWNS